MWHRTPTGGAPRSTGAPRAIPATQSASASANALSNRSAGSSRAPVLVKLGIAASTRSGGCSPSTSPPTTSSACHAFLPPHRDKSSHPNANYDSVQTRKRRALTKHSDRYGNLPATSNESPQPASGPFTSAVSVEPLHAAELKQQIARFLHSHKRL